MLLVEDTIRGLGGSYESLYLTARGLQRERYEPVVLFFQPNHFADRLREAGVRVLIGRSAQFWERKEYIDRTRELRGRMPRKGLLGAARKRAVAFLRTILGGVPMTWKILRIIREERIGLLHTNNNIQRDRMAILAGALADIPVVAHERQLAPSTLFTREVSRSVRIELCISDAVLEHARASGSRAQELRRVHNALDLTEYHGVRPSLDRGPPRVGIVGRILPKKGQKVFLEAAARIFQRVPAAEFWVIGGAAPGYQAHEEELKAYARAMGLEGHVNWTGYVEDPRALVASLDVVVHAAVEPEPFGRVLIEAMALGRPVVATAIGGPIEIIESGRSGFLVPPGDAGAIVERTLAILGDAELAARIGEEARRRVETAFSLDRYAAEIARAYDDALGRGREEGSP